MLLVWRVYEITNRFNDFNAVSPRGRLVKAMHYKRMNCVRNGHLAKRLAPSMIMVWKIRNVITLTKIKALSNCWQFWWRFCWAINGCAKGFVSFVYLLVVLVIISVPYFLLALETNRKRCDIRYWISTLAWNRNFNGGLANPPLNLAHGWALTSRTEYKVSLSSSH